MHPAPNNTELRTANDQPFNSRDTYKAHTQACTHTPHFIIMDILHQKLNYHIFARCYSRAVLNLSLRLPCTNVMGADTVTPRRLTLLQTQWVSACFSHNSCQTHYSRNWSIVFIIEALFHLTHISCRITDINIIFRATALCCSTHCLCLMALYVCFFLPCYSTWLCSCIKRGVFVRAFELTSVCYMFTACTCAGITCLLL